MLAEAVNSLLLVSPMYNFQHGARYAVDTVAQVHVKRSGLNRLPGPQQIKESGHEAQQSPLFYVFVTVFCLDRAQTTIGFEFRMSN